MMEKEMKMITDKLEKYIKDNLEKLHEGVVKFYESKYNEPHLLKGKKPIKADNFHFEHKIFNDNLQFKNDHELFCMTDVTFDDGTISNMGFCIDLNDVYDS